MSGYGTSYPLGNKNFTGGAARQGARKLHGPRLSAAAGLGALSTLVPG